MTLPTLQGEINKNGVLSILRKGILKPQSCCLSLTSDKEGHTLNLLCSDSCPLFGEPTRNDENIIVSLCHKLLIFSKLEDLRNADASTNI